ncbi:dockerin type I domain-containing protein [Acetivibrio saccincola]|uniref:Endoglucanase E n=1 Tax=Acetivibrio saccincola TaxID=1677857 RepID=A0A2K9DXS2_9FIRM|nr:dockerin type I domain-containing protein [Acetivibrio saccincola]HOA81285.1 dockerin type I domain-containing protein [Defluviitaleaceae bacterium]AUG56312.1 Endoglucanase E precursor [Acetivibrio saccincola]NLW27451.1 hypothetical protein [Acetivibrio saccincola]PQQ65487.1 hypothetical protein B9R14_01035 [Acetivibrio saccincola]HQD29581.1 dockerin type I domain-containing protein [Acetivibrio saccincola]
MKKIFKSLNCVCILSVFLLISVFLLNNVHVISANSNSITYGDINGDGNIDSTDVTLLKRFILNIINSLAHPKSADLNCDSIIDSIDYSILQRYVLQIISEFPIQNPPDNTSPSSYLTNSEKILFDLINEVRLNAGIEPFECDKDLVDVARIKSQEMVDDFFFSSISPTYGTTRELLNHFNIPFKYATETVSISLNATSSFNQLIQIDLYNEIITDPKYNYIGIGAIRCPIRGLVIVQIFVGR